MGDFPDDLFRLGILRGGLEESGWFPAEVWMKIWWRKVQKNFFKNSATVATGEMRKVNLR